MKSRFASRSEPSQAREIVLRAITHNVMIVRVWVFYRAMTTRFQAGAMRAWGT